MFRLWADCNTHDLESVENVIIPIGAVEQHGGHMPVGTDMFLVEGFVNALLKTEIEEDFYILPVLPLGKSSEHLLFAGTVSLSAHTLVSIFEDIVSSLAGRKIKRLVVLSGHGGNNGIVDTMLFDIRQKYGIEAYAMHLGYMFGRSGDPLCSLPYSMHAGYAETSVMKYFYPDRFARLYEKCPIGASASSGFDFLNELSPVTSYGWATEDISIHGYIGDPSMSSYEKGKKIAGAVVDFMVKELVKIVHKEGFDA